MGDFWDTTRGLLCPIIYQSQQNHISFIYPLYQFEAFISKLSVVFEFIRFLAFYHYKRVSHYCKTFYGVFTTSLLNHSFKRIVTMIINHVFGFIWLSRNHYGFLFLGIFIIIRPIIWISSIILKSLSLILQFLSRFLLLHTRVIWISLIAMTILHHYFFSSYRFLVIWLHIYARTISLHLEVSDTSAISSLWNHYDYCHNIIWIFLVIT